MLAFPGEGQQAVQQDLVPGRECGECHVCCVALTVDTPDLQKPAGFRCPHAAHDLRCTIYADRFDICRTFYCGYRLLPFVPESLRPDRSGVLVRHTPVAEPGQPPTTGLLISLLDRRSLRAPGLAELVITAIAAGIPTYLNIPGPRGYNGGDARMNEMFAGAVAARDKPAILELLRQARQKGLSGTFRPVVLRHGPSAEAATP